eukprot:maker-scaffold_48-snap-gene-1.47-mRNA-1 protein AED:0.01 eAED:0.01 QI:63/1/1/1/1/1/4/99/623
MNSRVIKVILGGLFGCTVRGFNRIELKQNLLEKFNDGSKVIRVDLQNSVYGSRSEFEKAMAELGLNVDFVGEKVNIAEVKEAGPRKLMEPERVSEVVVTAQDDLEVLRVLAENEVAFEDSTSSWVEEKIKSFEQDDFFCKGEECVERELQEFFSSYHELSAIHARFDAISEANINRTLIDSLGQSYEGRDLKMMWIGEGQEEFSTDFEKPLVLYMCNIHAREWLTPLYCTYMAERLLDGSDESNDLLSKFTFVIAPSMNPDGYVFSYTNDTLWRKTRMPNNGTECVGTDGNRNWGPEAFHCGEGASTNPCSVDYCGVEPFDQPETAAIAAFSESVASRIFAFNDVHSYGRYFMSPWGWTYDLPPAEDYERMKQCFMEVRDAIYDISGDIWTVGTSANAIYIAAGGSDDWYYSELDVIYANTFELRGDSFQPDPSNIMPSNLEAYAGMSAHLNCAYDIEFVTPSPGAGPTSFPTSYPTLSCRNSASTGLTIDGVTEATCEELEPYCEDFFDLVADPCPITCDACDLYWGGVPGEEPEPTVAPTVSNVTSVPSSNPTVVKEEETTSKTEAEFNLDEMTVLMLLFILMLVVIFLLFVVRTKRRKKHVVQEMEMAQVDIKDKHYLEK